MSPRRTPAALTVTPLEPRSLPAAFFPTLYTAEQVDLQADFTGSAWSVDYTNRTTFFGASALKSSAFYLSPSARVATPAGADFAFLGAGSGRLAYVLPQARDATLPQLGISTNGTFTGSLAAYETGDPRAVGSKVITTSGRYLRMMRVTSRRNSRVCCR